MFFKHVFPQSKHVDYLTKGIEYTMIRWSVGYLPTLSNDQKWDLLTAFEVFRKGITDSSSLTILENLLAGFLEDFKDLISTQKSKHTMHSIV